MKAQDVLDLIPEAANERDLSAAIKSTSTADTANSKQIDVLVSAGKAIGKVDKKLAAKVKKAEELARDITEIMDAVTDALQEMGD